MRIALLGSGMLPVPPEGYGAVEKHVASLADALRARGHDVHVVSRVFGRQPWNEYRFARWALRETRRLKPDIVHAHTTGVAATFAAARRRFVYTSHSRHWMSVSGTRERIGLGLERYAVGRAAAVVALTEDVAAKVRLVSNLRNVPVHVVPNGVDPTAYAPEPDAREGTQALSVGVVAPHKGHHLAARAAKRAGFRLVVVGPEVDVAYARALRVEGIDVKGAVRESDLRRLYATSDVFVHLSTSEALSLAVLEAMSSSLPLVASDVCRGQVLDGETGISIPTAASDEARVEAAASALKALREDPVLRKRLAEGARRVAIRDFSWESVAARVEGVYAEVAR